jgi:hypothetical protein
LSDISARRHHRRHRFVYRNIITRSNSVNTSYFKPSTFLNPAFFEVQRS